MEQLVIYLKSTWSWSSCERKDIEMPQLLGDLDSNAVPTNSHTHTHKSFSSCHTHFWTQNGDFPGTERGLASSGVCLKCANWEYM